MTLQCYSPATRFDELGSALSHSHDGGSFLLDLRRCVRLSPDLGWCSRAASWACAEKFMLHANTSDFR